MEEIEDDADDMISPLMVPEKFAQRNSIMSIGNESGRGSYGAHMGMSK